MNNQTIRDILLDVYHHLIEIDEAVEQIRAIADYERINKMIQPQTYMGLSVPVKKKLLAELNAPLSNRADWIVTQICDYFGEKESYVKGLLRKREFTVPRQVCMYFLRQKTSLSLKNIGQIFNGRDHSTVLYAIQTVNDFIDTDRVFARSIRDIEAILSGCQPEVNVNDRPITIADTVTI